MKLMAFVLLVLIIFLVPSAAFPADTTTPDVKIGSKTFTESVILGDMVSLLVRNAGAQASQRRELGGTRVLWNALLNGEIDIYPEYTGTIARDTGRQRFTSRGRDTAGFGCARDHDDPFAGFQ